MSLLQCIAAAKLPENLAARLTGAREAKIALGMSEASADRAVLEDYGRELHSRLNALRTLAGQDALPDPGEDLREDIIMADYNKLIAEVNRETEVIPGRVVDEDIVISELPTPQNWISLDSFQPSLPAINIYSGDVNGFENLSNLNNGPVTTNKAQLEDILAAAGMAIHPDLVKLMSDKAIVFPTVEHMYQSLKGLVSGDRAGTNNIRLATTGAAAQKAGRKITGLDTAKWDAGSAVILERAMRLAFEQNEANRELLLSTGQAPLTHRSKTGRSLGRWTKEFPEILMRIRAELDVKPAAATDPNPTDYTNHSGGADGADEAWHRIPKKLGYMTKDVHWREPGQTTVDSKTLRNEGVMATPMPAALYAKGKEMADRIDAMFGENPNRGYAHYRYRNYAQVANADAVFAISKGFGERNGRYAPLDRGTLYAIYGAILDGKPVFVFDQKAKVWRTWKDDNWAPTGTPKLTKNFAGIGTRTLLDAGRQAIADVFHATFGGSDTQEVPLSGFPVNKGPEGSLVYDGLIDRLGDNQVFVFGANDRGLHGAGSAAVAMGEKRSEKEAKTMRGKQGKWTVMGSHSELTVGTEGQSWPLVTVTGELGGKHSGNRMPAEAILSNIKAMYDYAAANPQLEFLVAYTATGKNLNGYKPEEMASLFASFPVPSNVVFERQFKGLMLNSSVVFTSIMVSTEDQSARQTVALSPEQIQEAQRQNFVEIRDASGAGTGKFFTSEQQIQAVDGILYTLALYLQYKLQPGQKINAQVAFDYIRQQMQNYWTDFGNKERGVKIMKNGIERYADMTAEQASVYRRNLEDVINSFDGLKEVAVTRLDALGIKMVALDEQSLEEQQPELIAQNGSGVESFHEVAFTLNPRDLASGRIKLFMSTIEDSEEGVLTKPRPISLKIQEQNRNAIYYGNKKTSFRTAAVMEEHRMSPSQGYNTRLINITGPDGVSTLFVVRAVKTMTAQDADDFNNGPDAETYIDKDTGESRPLLAKEGDVLLSFEPYVEKIGLRPRVSFINMPKLADFDSLFERVTGLLADRTPSFTGYMEILQDPNQPPTVRKLAERLKAANPRIQREFVQVMTKAFNEFVMVQYTNSRDGMKVNWVNANMYSMRRTVERSWKEAQKNSPIMKMAGDGSFVLNDETIASLQERYNALKAMPKDAKTAAAWNKAAADLARDLLAANGIVMPQKAEQELFTPLGLTDGWAMNADGKSGGTFAVMLNRLAGNIPMDGELESSIERNNPLYMDRSLVSKLITTYVKHAEVLFNSSHRDSNGNNIWDYSLKTGLDNTWKDITSEEGAHRKQLQRTHIAKGNWLLSALDTDPAVRRSMRIMYLEDMKRKGSKRNKERSKMSKREQDFMAVNLFANSGRSTINLVGLTHSDKTRTPVYMNIPRTNTWSNGRPSKHLMDRLKQIFNGEFDRIFATASQTFDSKQFEQGKKYFFQLPQFNYEAMRKAIGTKVVYKLVDGQLRKAELTAEDVALIWKKDGTLNGEAKGQRAFNELVEGLLIYFVEEETTLQREAFLKSGVLQTEMEDGKLIYGKLNVDVDYIKRVVEARTGLRSIKGKYTLNGKEISKGDYNYRVATYAARDFAMNGFLFNAFLVQSVTGDMAMTWKKTVEQTMVEYQKRLAGIIAPGKETEWESPTFQSISLKDITIPLDYLTSVSSKYGDVNITDAQELITMKEHLEVLKRFGNIDEQVFKEMTAIIDAAGPGGYYEFTERSHKDVVLQISKPVYFGPRPEDRGVILYDYVKSSAIPLYPPWTAGAPIDKLRSQMEKAGIARAHFESARKIGDPGPVSALRENGYTPFDPTKATTMQRSNFRIQQEVPYDPDKQYIQIFSQANKLFVADLPADMVVNVYGKSMNRAEIRRYKEELRINMLQENLNEFLAKNGVERAEDEKGQPIWKFKDRKAFIQTLIREAKESGFAPNEILPLTTLTRDGEPIAPVAYTALGESVHNLMMSMVDKLIKVKVHGRSYVQASAAGIRRMDTSVPGGVVWTPGSSAEQGLRFLRKEDGTVQAAEVLVPFRFFAGKNAIKLSSVLNEDGTIDPEKLPAELLHMVGIRIPTSKHNTMLPLKIAGFLPENMGDTIIVPNGITTQMGSDFDVDKLFVYQRPYYSQDRKLYVDQESNSAKYFELQWQVLTSAKMFEAITAPLDKDDLKNEVALLGSSGIRGNGLSPRRQLADFISQKDAKGLVGATALTNTLLAGIQEMSIVLSRIEIMEDGNGKPFAAKVTDPIKRFKVADNSEPLSLYQFGGYGLSTYVNDLVEGGEPEIRSKMDNIGIIMQEALDHAKHRTIDKLNITLNTYNALAALMALENSSGFALDLRYATRLAMQEYVVRFNDLISEGEDMLSGYTADLKAKVFAQLYEELIAAGADEKAAESMSFTAEQLKELVLIGNDMKDGKDAGYYTAQLALLQTFETLDKAGKRMSELSNLMNQDVNGTNGNIYSVIDKLTKANDILDAVPLDGSLAMLENMDGTPTERGWLFQHVNNIAADLFSDDLPHVELYGSILQSIAGITGRKSMTEVPMDVKKDVTKAFRSLLYSGMQALGVRDATGERVRLFYNTEQGPSLAARVRAAKNSWGMNNHFLRRLDTLQQDAGLHDVVTYQAVQVTRMDDQDSVRAWLDMLISQDPEKRLLGEDLVRYALLTGGVQDANSFVRYIPFSYLLSKGWFSELREMHDNRRAIMNSEAFLLQWFQHNPERAIQITPGFEDIAPDIEGVPESFEMPVEDSSEQPSKAFVRYTVTDSTGEQVYPPFLSYRTEEGNIVLYAATGESTLPSRGVRYIRIDTKGDQYTDEYDMNNAKARSALAANRAINQEWMDAVQLTVQSKNPVSTVRSAAHPMFIKYGYSEGGNLHTMLKTIAKDDTLPQYLYELYSWLLKLETTEDMAGASLLEAGVPFGRDIPVVLKEDPEAEGFSYYFELAPSTGELDRHMVRLPRKFKPDKAYLHESIAHESLHALSAVFVAQYQKGVLKNEGVKAALQELEKLYNELKEQLPNYDSDELRYATSSLHEFITMSMSNKAVMQILNGIKAKDPKKRSMLAVILERIAKFFSAIGEALGVPVDEKSILGQAIPHIQVLMEGSTVNEVELLSIDTIQYKGVPLDVYTKDGKIIQVSDNFLREQPEPLRQKAIAKLKATYAANPDIDPSTGQRFRGTTIQEIQPEIPFIEDENTTEEDNTPDDEAAEGQELSAMARRYGTPGPWTFRNPLEAAYEKEIQEKQFPEGQELGAYYGSKGKTTPKVNPKVQILVDKLEDQKSDIWRSMTADRDKTVRAAKKLQIKKIEDDIKLLIFGDNGLHGEPIKGGTISAVAAVAKRQVEALERSLSKDMSAAEVFTAIHAAELWSNLISTLYTTNLPSKLDPALQDIAGRAQFVLLKLHNDKALSAMQEISTHPLTAEDFTEKLVDLPGFTTWALSLNRASSQLVQAIDMLMKNAARRRDEEVRALSERLRTLDGKVNAYAKSKGIQRADVFNLMIEDRKKAEILSLVQRFASVWYINKSRWSKTRTGQIEKTLEKITDPARVASKVGAEWGEYWDHLKSSAVVADVTKLFDEDGSRKDTYDEEKARLLEELKDEGMVNEMLTAAEDLVVRYAEDWEAYQAVVESQRMEGSMTDEAAADALQEFVRKQSPFRFMEATNTRNSKLGWDSHGDRYLVIYPKPENTDFYDKKYTEINKSPELSDIYNSYKKMLKELRDKLPLHIQARVFDNFLPAVSAHLIHEVGFKEYVRTMDTRVVDSLTGSQSREMQPDRKTLPLPFVEFSGELSSYSRDFTRIIEMFGGAVAHYRHFSLIKDAVDLGETLIKEKDRAMKMENPAAGLSNLLSALDYTKSYLMYRNPRKLEGNLNMKLYSLNPKEQARISREVKEKMKERHETELQLLDPPAGMTEEDIQKKLDSIDAELSAYENRDLYMSKIGDRLIGINQLKALAFNPFSGFANFAFGMISLSVFAQGRKEMTPKTVRTAMKLVNSATTKWLTFGKVNNDTAQKIFVLMERVGMMGDIVDTQYGESNVHTSSKLRKTLDPYTFLRSSDYYTKAVTLVSHMLHTKTTVVKDGESKEVSLWEAFDQEGNWAYENAEGWQDADPGKRDKWEAFRNRSIRLGQIIMGNTDKNSPKMINKYILGRLIAQFRASWLPEGLALRFEEEKYDQQLGRTIKGRYRTAIDLGMGTAVKVLARQFLNMFAKIDVYDGIYIKGKPLAESEVDVENMKRNFAGLMWTASIMGGVLLIKALRDDDDDEFWSSTAMIALNLLNRVNQDLRFYTSPDVANNLTRNVIPAFDVINDYIRAVHATQKAISSDEYDWDQALLKWTKATPYANQINRLMYMSSKDISEISR